MIVEKIRVWNQSFNSNTQDRIHLGIPLFISLLIKMILMASLYNSPINNDGTFYIKLAKHFAVGDFLSGAEYYLMPAYSMLLALVHIVIPDWIFAGYFIAMISIVFATIPLYFLTKTMFGVKEGFWACLIFATLPRMNEWSMYISRDPLFLALFSCCIFFSLKAIAKKDIFLFGVTFVLAWLVTLTRIEGAFFIGFYLLVLIFFALIDKNNRSIYISGSLIWAGIPLGIVSLALISSELRGIVVNRFDIVFSAYFNFLNGDLFKKSFQIYNFFSEAIKHPPFFNGHYSFAALCKHYLPIIYMFGIIEALFKIVFPSSLIPLYYGLKSKKKSHGYSGKYILWVWILFAGLGYLFLITMDLIATRYLMIPAFLLLPWIGLGLKQLWDKVNDSSSRKIFLVLIAVILFAPTIKSFKLILSRDTITANTVHWLINNDKINNSSIVVNNYMDSFYIDLEAQEIAVSDWKTHYYKKELETAVNIEKFAIEKNAEIIVFKMKSKNIDMVDKFQLYQHINTCVGNKYTTFIYVKGINHEN